MFSEQMAVDCGKLGWPIASCSGGVPFAVWNMAQSLMGMATRSGYSQIVIRFYFSKKLSKEPI